MGGVECLAEALVSCTDILRVGVVGTSRTTIIYPERKQDLERFEVVGNHPTGATGEGLTVSLLDLIGPIATTEGWDNVSSIRPKWGLVR